MSKTDIKEIESKLEPCLFCGRQSFKIFKGGSTSLKECYWVVCIFDSCGAEGPVRKSALQAANAWNKVSKKVHNK